MIKADFQILKRKFMESLSKISNSKKKNKDLEKKKFMYENRDQLLTEIESLIE